VGEGKARPPQQKVVPGGYLCINRNSNMPCADRGSHCRGSKEKAHHYIAEFEKRELTFTVLGRTKERKQGGSLWLKKTTRAGIDVAIPPEGFPKLDRL